MLFRSNRYGGDLLFQNKREKVSYLIGLDYNRNTFDGSAREESSTRHQDIESYINMSGDRNRGRRSSGLRGNVEWNAGDSDILTVDGRYGGGEWGGDSNRDYKQWTDADIEPNYYLSFDESERSGSRFGLNLSWLHRFSRKDHEITGQVHYGRHDGDELTFNELRNANLEITDGMRSFERGPSSDLRIKVDYTLPFNDQRKFEAGYQSEIDKSTEDTGAEEFDPSVGRYVELANYAHTTVYDRATHALYTIYSHSLGNLGVQGGLRAERTDRNVELKNGSQKATINRWDLFPSLHISYQLGNSRQAMASYSRRIERPRGFQLEPFLTWRDAYNVWTGYPAIQPEYIHSYEVGYSMPVGNSMFSTELYYRESVNKIEWVRSVYGDNVTLHTVDNVGTDYALGTELMIDTDIGKFWNLGLTGNLYDYRIEGERYGESFSRQSFNWSTRMNNTFKLTKTLQLQLTGRYNSPTVSAQGRREGFFLTDVALRKDFFDKVMSLTVQMRDLFGQARWEFTSQGPDFYSYSNFSRQSRIVMVNLRVNINNYKQNNERNGNGEMNGGGGEGGDF